MAVIVASPALILEYARITFYRMGLRGLSICLPLGLAWAIPVMVR